jgi:hypothetical protein
MRQLPEFSGDLDTKEIGKAGGRVIHLLQSKLGWGQYCIPIGFQTDYASVPRVPIAFWLWGDRAHRPAVLHDYLYRKDSRPVVTKRVADRTFREAILSTEGRGPRGLFIAWGMWLGVWLGGRSSYHKLYVNHQFVDYVDPVQ